MFLIAFVLLALSQGAAPPAPQDEINDALAHAEALYNAARFGEAMTLLMRIDDVLSKQPERLKDRVQTKLQLALASVGLDDTARAQSFFMELYALNPDYALDGPQFSPKVMRMAAEAKMEQTRTRCAAAQADARTDLDSGQTKAFLDLIQSSGSNCIALAAMRPEAAEVFYRAGIASYKRGEFSDALSNFETALMLYSEHQLAREYADLTRSRLQLGQCKSLSTEIPLTLKPGQ